MTTPDKPSIPAVDPETGEVPIIREAPAGVTWHQYDTLSDVFGVTAAESILTLLGLGKPS